MVMIVGVPSDPRSIRMACRNLIPQMSDVQVLSQWVWRRFIQGFPKLIQFTPSHGALLMYQRSTLHLEKNLLLIQLKQFLKQFVHSLVKQNDFF